MASANFLEEALSTDVDESAVSAIVGSLENQLVTSTPAAPNQTATTVVVNQNHVNSSAIPNGGTAVPSQQQQQQKHGAIANGDTVNVVAAATAPEPNKLVVTNSIITTGPPAANFTDASKPAAAEQSVKIIGGPAMTTTGPAIISTSRVGFPQGAQSLPNGTIGLAPITNAQQAKQQPTLVIKTSAATGAPGLVTVPMNVTASVPQVNNVGTCSSTITTQQTTPNTILSNLQVVNVRPGVTAQGQKGQPARVVLSAPQLVGARPGAPVS